MRLDAERVGRRPGVAARRVSAAGRAVAAALAAGGLACGGAPDSAAQDVICTLERVIDGDTVVCRGGERVRLIGIDTPEMNDAPLGKLARDFLVSLAAPGTRLRVERDVELRDRYGRLLAYLYLPDGHMLNLELVRAGYAVPYTLPPNVRYVDEILAASRAARAEGAGLWGHEGFGDDSPGAESR